MWHFFDRITNAVGTLAAWIFFVIGLIVTFEVVMRYAFNSPTIWVDEISRVLQIWATCLAAGYALRHRALIVIDVIFSDPQRLGRKICETLAILMIIAFALVVTKYGFDLWLKATLSGHTTDSFLASPKWLTHASIWIGFGMLALQGLVELARIWLVGLPEKAEKG